MYVLMPGGERVLIRSSHDSSRYARVIHCRHPDLQRDPFKAARCYRIFVDKASGAPDDRPGLAEVLDQLQLEIAWWYGSSTTSAGRCGISSTWSASCTVLSGTYDFNKPRRSGRRSRRAGGRLAGGLQRPRGDGLRAGRSGRRAVRQLRGRRYESRPRQPPAAPGH